MPRGGKRNGSGRPKAKQEPAEPALRLEWRSPSELAENPANWRRHPPTQISALSDVLTEVGWAGACLFNEQTGRLIDGHARRKVALEQGCEQVPVLVGSWDEATEKKILATLDPLAAMADTDTAALEALLRDVQTSSQAVGDMLTKLAEEAGVIPPGKGAPAEDPGPQPDRAKELHAKWDTATGQLWVIPSKATPGKEHRLLCGDSTKAGDVARVMAGEKAGLMVSDPPYAVDYVEKARDMNRRGYVHSRGKRAAAIEGDGIEDGQEEGLWRAALEAAYAEAVADNAAVYLWHAQGRAMMILYNLLAEMGFLHHQTLIWRKNNFVIGRCDYQGIHEPCFYGWKKGNRPPFYGEKNQTTVWDEARDTQHPDHPTQKPVAIFKPPMTNHLLPAGLAYEPFCGSGTTLVAAEQTGRLCRGIEISPAYVAVALERLAGMGLEPLLTK